MRNGQNGKLSACMCRLLSIVNGFKSLFKNQLGKLNVMVYTCHPGRIWNKIESSQPALAKKCQLPDNCMFGFTDMQTVSCFKLFYRLKIVKPSYHPVSSAPQRCEGIYLKPVRTDHCLHQSPAFCEDGVLVILYEISQSSGTSKSFIILCVPQSKETSITSKRTSSFQITMQ